MQYKAGYIKAILYLCRDELEACTCGEPYQSIFMIHYWDSRLRTKMRTLITSYLYISKIQDKACGAFRDCSLAVVYLFS